MLGSVWSPVVVLLTTNSLPAVEPLVLKTWPWIAKPVASKPVSVVSVHSTMNWPPGSAAALASKPPAAIENEPPLAEPCSPFEPLQR